MRTRLGVASAWTLAAVLLTSACEGESADADASADGASSDGGSNDGTAGDGARSDGAASDGGVTDAPGGGDAAADAAGEDATGDREADVPAPACAGDPRVDAWKIGLGKMGESNILRITVVAATPNPPAQGHNTWGIHVVDAEDNPVNGAFITVTPYMPDHGHGSPMKVGVSYMGEGLYVLDPIALTMGGFWTLTIKVDAASKSDTAVFGLCIADP